MEQNFTNDTPREFLEDLQNNIEASTKKRTRGLGKKNKVLKTRRHFDFPRDVIDALNRQVSYYGKNQSDTLSLIILKNARDIEKEELNIRKIQSLDFAELLAKQANYIADLTEELDTLKKNFEAYKSNIDGRVNGGIETAISNLNKNYNYKIKEIDRNAERLNLCVRYIVNPSDKDIKLKAIDDLRELG